MEKAEDLGLEGELLIEWNNYIKGLVGSGFELNNDKDLLLWSWDTKFGQVSAKQAYDIQMEILMEMLHLFGTVRFGDWMLPLKN
jgi:hypothetical protein